MSTEKQDTQSQYADLTQTSSKLVAELFALEKRLHDIPQAGHVARELEQLHWNARTIHRHLMELEGEDWKGFDVVDFLLSGGWESE